MKNLEEERKRRIGKRKESTRAPNTLKLTNETLLQREKLLSARLSKARHRGGPLRFRRLCGNLNWLSEVPCSASTTLFLPYFIVCHLLTLCVQVSMVMYHGRELL